MSFQAKFLSAIYRINYPSGVHDFERVFVELLPPVMNVSRLEVEQMATSRNLTRYWNCLLKQIEVDERRGLSPLFVVRNRDRRKLVPFADTVPMSDSARRKHSARVASARWRVLLEIDALSSRQFEALGCVACEYIGARDVHLTPSGREGGIDFLARLTVREDNHLFGRSAGGIRIVGQCKKWGRPIEPGDVKQFVETIGEVKHKSPALPDVIPSWFFETSGPIVGWMISEHGCASGAAERMHNHGLLSSNSIDLAELLTIPRKISRLPSVDRKAAKIRDDVQRMLQRFL